MVHLKIHDLQPSWVSMFFHYCRLAKIGFREGMYMASADEIYLKVIGKGGHGAAPESVY